MCRFLCVFFFFFTSSPSSTFLFFLFTIVLLTIFLKVFRVKDKCVCYLNGPKKEARLLINRFNELPFRMVRYSAFNLLSFRLFISVYVFKLITHTHKLKEQRNNSINSSDWVHVQRCFKLMFFFFCFTMTRFTTLFRFLPHLSKCCFRMSHNNFICHSTFKKEKKTTATAQHQAKQNKIQRRCSKTFGKQIIMKEKLEIKISRKSMCFSFMRWHFRFQANLYEWHLVKFSISISQKHTKSKFDENNNNNDNDEHR